MSACIIFDWQPLGGSSRGWRKKGGIAKGEARFLFGMKGGSEGARGEGRLASLKHNTHKKERMEEINGNTSHMTLYIYTQLRQSFFFASSRRHLFPPSSSPPLPGPTAALGTRLSFSSTFSSDSPPNGAGSIVTAQSMSVSTRPVYACS